MSNNIESPCIGVCSVNPNTGYCHGCSRTQEEMDSWSTMSDKEKIKLINELEKRQDELFGD